MALPVKQGDLFPDVETTVTDENNVAIDLTGASLVFFMRNARNPSSVKVNGAAGVLVNAVSGKIAYRWSGADTDTPGTYEGEFRITPAGGGDAFRVPTTGYVTINVEPKVA